MNQKLNEIEELQEPSIEELMEGGVELCVCESCMIMFRPEANVDNLIDTAPCPECGKLCKRTMCYYGDKGPGTIKLGISKLLRKLHVKGA